MEDYTRRPDADVGEPVDEAAYAIAHRLAEEALGKVRGHINRRHPELYNATATILCTAHLFALLNTTPEAAQAINSVLNRHGCHWKLVPAEPAN